MTRPKPLGPGSRIRVVSPASPLTPDQVEEGVRFFEGLGCSVEMGEHVFAKDGYLAGADEKRAADLMAAFTDDGIDAVVCSRGGYGCARLLPHLDLDAMAASGRMFVGFSDVTTLHLAMQRRGLSSFHAPMLITLSVEREPWVRESLKRLVTGEADPLGVDHPRADTVVGGSVEGVITAGCLCLLCDSIGTPDPLEAEGRILMIEDVDESPHRVDAMLTHLRNTGILQSAAGIVIGEMTRTDEKVDEGIGEWPWRRIVEDRLAGLDVPTIINYPFGHMKNMLSFPLGVKARLDADAGRLSLPEPTCAA